MQLHGGTLPHPFDGELIALVGDPARHERHDGSGFALLEFDLRYVDPTRNHARTESAQTREALLGELLKKVALVHERIDVLPRELIERAVSIESAHSQDETSAHTGCGCAVRLFVHPLRPHEISRGAQSRIESVSDYDVVPELAEMIDHETREVRR